MALRHDPLLTASAALYFAVGVALLFAAEEILGISGTPPSDLETALLQLLGAALFAFSMLNWMNRFARVGGIFGRPLAMANFTLAAVSALMLVSVVRQAGLTPLLGAGLTGYALLAVGFGAKLFGGGRTDGGASC